MKIKKIPFTIDEYNSGKYDVVTRDNKKVRIICTDYKDKVYNVIGLITTQDNRESVVIYNSSGIYKMEENSEDRRDLFLKEFIFEDGDIIINKDNEIAIFNSDISKINTFNYYVLLSKNKVLLYNYKTEKKKIRLATQEEEQKLFNHLLKENKLWDKEKKCIIHTKYINTLLKFEDIDNINTPLNINNLLYFYNNAKKISAEGIIELVEYLIGEIKATNIDSIDSVNQKNLERLQDVVNTLQGKIIEAVKTYE